MQADPLQPFARWLYAASTYNLLWGLANVAFPRRIFHMLRMKPPDQLPLWQVIGMMVAVYAPAYWWAARNPRRHPHVVAVGLLGKILGPVGYAWALRNTRLPRQFGWIILTNDLIWWPTLGAYVARSAQAAGGWRAFLSGSTPEYPSAPHLSE